MTVKVTKCQAKSAENRTLIFYASFEIFTAMFQVKVFDL